MRCVPVVLVAFSITAASATVEACNSGDLVPVAQNGTDSGSVLDSSVGAPESAGDSAVLPKCSGMTPSCFGTDLRMCCGQDPSGLALCQGGQWICGEAGAPGCNGMLCFGVDSGMDSGTDSSVGCVGTAPNCFGNNLQSCCGQDPSGIATCKAGQWTCGTVPAPGCNGMSCFPPLDAGQG